MQTPDPIEYWAVWSPSRGEFARWSGGGRVESGVKLIISDRAALENYYARDAGEPADWTPIRVTETYSDG